MDGSQFVTTTSSGVPTPAPKAAAPVEAVKAPVEGAPPAEPVKEEKKESISSQLAILARKEKAALERGRKAQADLAEAQKIRAEAEKLRSEFEGKKKRFQEDPDAILEEFGLSYEKLTERKLNGGTLSAEDVRKEMEEKFNSLQKQREAEETAKREAEEKTRTESEKKAIEEYQGKLKGFIEEKKGEFKLTHLFDPAADLVLETVDAYYEKNQKVLSNDEACKLVEKYFVGLYEQAAKVMAAIEEKKEAAKEPKNDDAGFQPPKTLTNTIVSSAPSLLPAKTEADRMRRAMAALDKR